MKKLIVCLAVGALFAIGCNRNSGEKARDPLAALAARHKVSKYGYPFWKDQFRHKTDLWSTARSFCEAPEHISFVNCRPVLTVAENASANNWLGKGTPIPFGLVPKSPTESKPH